MSLAAGDITFLFTDIEGSTALWEQHPGSMRDALHSHDTLLRTIIEGQGGHVFKSLGDAFFAAFASAPDAVRAALDAQRALAAQEWGLPSRLKVRMALSTGEAQPRDNDYFGPALSRVARLLAAAHGGQTLLSEATAANVRRSLPTDASLRDLGRHRLKDLPEPQTTFQFLHPDLPDDFPPLRSLQAFAHNLPWQLTNFVGRSREMGDIQQKLSGTRLLTLTGVGGSGKTRLALQAAAELVDRYPDGVWLVELASLSDPALIAQTVASSLSVHEERYYPLEKTLTDHLRNRTTLLILDNCEHLLDACARLATQLLQACPHLTILATSREALNISGENLYPVPPLPTPDLERLPALDSLREYDGVRLFLERAEAASPTFRLSATNAAAVAQICRRLDGLPLALELAAVWVNALSVEQISQRLGQRFRLLTGGNRAALPRQQTLLATVDWSYDLLSEPERALLRRLAIFTGGWTLEAAEAVCPGTDIDEWEVLDLLSRLAEKSLIVIEQQGSAIRYRLLETLRQYGLDRLAEAGEVSQMQERHRDYFLAQAEAAEGHLFGSPEQMLWLTRLDLDYANLRAVLQNCAAAEGDAASGLRLTGALWRFWDIRSHFTEGREWLTEMLDKNRDAPDSLRTRSLCGAALLAARQNDHEAATALAEDGLAQGRTRDDTWEIAFCLSVLGYVEYYRGNADRSAALLEEGVELFRRLESKWGVAFSLFLLGAASLSRGDYQRTTALCREGAVLARELGDKWNQAWSTYFLGVAASAQDDFPEAKGRLEESLTLFREVGENFGISYALYSLGHAALLQEDYRSAGPLRRDCLSFALKASGKRGIGFSLLGYGCLAAARGRPERAVRLFGATEALFDAIHAPPRPCIVAAVTTGSPTCARLWATRRSPLPETMGAVWTWSKPSPWLRRRIRRRLRPARQGFPRWTFSRHRSLRRTRRSRA